MPDDTEIELKLRVKNPPELANMLRDPILLDAAEPRSVTVHQLRALYFDTTDRRLQKAGIAYRIRREDEQWIATVKTDLAASTGGLHQRREWNVAAADDQPDLSLFRETPIGLRLTQTVGEASLQKMFETRVERSVLNIKTPGGGWVEFAADRGEIVAAEKSDPIAEVEFELKAGRAKELLLLGAALSTRYSLLLESRSKFARGLALAGIETKEEKKNQPTPDLIRATDPAGASLRILLLRQLQAVIQAQQCFLNQPYDAEMLHQLRLSLRGLRSMLSFAKPLLPTNVYAEKQAQLREWSRKLAKAREIDVLLATWREMDENKLSFTQEQSWLKALLETAQGQEKEGLEKLLLSGQFTPDLLSFWAWLLELEELKSEDQRTLAQYAQTRLRKWMTRLLKVGKQPDLTDAAFIHQLRIDCKKLRYVLQVLEPILGDGFAKLLLRLRFVQDYFGELYDSYRSPKVIQRLISDQTMRGLDFDAGMMSGWYTYRVMQARRRAGRCWKRFLNVGTYWVKKHKTVSQAAVSTGRSLPRDMP